MIKSLRFVAVFMILVAGTVRAEAPNRQRPRDVKGEIRDLGGLRTMRVWGTPREQGYAQGYLLGEECVQLLDKYLQAGGPDAIKAYEVGSFMMTRTMKIAPRYQEEMQGLIEGVKAKVGDKIVVSALNRPLEYRDLVAVNCIPETARVGCSSFAVWGPMTVNGETIAGRNLDWYHNPALDDSQILVVRINGEKDSALSWASLTWPGFIGCLTGMNAEGVTVSVHDAPGGRATDGERLTPRGLALREAVESAHASTAVEDVARVLRQRTCMVGNNVPVAMPFLGKGPGSVVFEYDGNLEKDGGVTIRAVENDPARPCMQACTNHYRSRAESISCDRYERLEEDATASSKSGRKVDVAAAFSMLDDVAMTGRCMTYHSVVFEPNQRKMHVRLSQGKQNATKSRPIVVDVASLLSRDGGGKPRGT